MQRGAAHLCVPLDSSTTLVRLVLVDSICVQYSSCHLESVA